MLISSILFLFPSISGFKTRWQHEANRSKSSFRNVLGLDDNAPIINPCTSRIARHTTLESLFLLPIIQ